MADQSYVQPGLILARDDGGTVEQVKALQHDLRALGYLHHGIDGDFGSGTERAVKALQYDLLENDGGGNDGEAPVAVTAYRQGRDIAVTGRVDQDTAACIAAMMADPQFPKLPRSDTPAQDNAAIVETVRALRSDRVPIPFMIAMFRQESGLRHFRVPTHRDDDSFIVVGLDRNRDAHPEAVTSRGYGLGQYTLFHHPPTPPEVGRYLLDPPANLAAAVDEYRTKFDGFITGPTDGTRADDRIAEHGDAPLRPCRFEPTDARHLRDCRNCAVEAGSTDIVSGTTPLYPGSGSVYQPTPNYGSADYAGVPVRANFHCDWPYASRRYNGSGIGSYHYQARILRNLLR